MQKNQVVLAGPKALLQELHVRLLLTQTKVGRNFCQIRQIILDPLYMPV